MPSKVLCVAEKPSIAKAIAQALTRGERYETQNTADRYVKNYKFDYNFRQWGHCPVVVTSVRGHLYRTDFDRQAYGWNSCDPIQLLDPATPFEIQTPKDNEGMVNNIANQARGCRFLYIWTDCDREGEHIGSEIIKAARTRNARLAEPQIKRATFNNTAHDHLRQAADNPGDLDWNSVRAVEARMEFDLRTGAAYTRLQCRILQQLGPLKEEMISYGSCQFPTLGFIVDRYKRIKEFKPEDFFYIEVKFKRGDSEVGFKWDRNRLYDRLATVALFERGVNLGNEAVVTSVEVKPTSRRKPLPLTTVDLQKQGARWLQMSSKRVMDVAEKLYNEGYLSYPRTETNRFAPEIDLHALIHKQLGTTPRPWTDFAANLVNGDGFERPRDGNKDDKAHPPIHPVNSAPNSLNHDEKRVYEFVTRHFLACCSKDAVGEQTKVSINWHDETFHTTGVVIKARNFLNVYPYIKWETNELCEFVKNERINLTEMYMREGKTSPPKPLTEPELIGLMDANGIGTDATMAEHISTVQTRNYAVTEKRGNATYFLPTALGCGLVDSYDQMDFDLSLTKPFVRKDTEEHLQKICNGEMTKREFIGEWMDVYQRLFNMAQQNAQLLKTTTRRYLENP